MLRQLLVRASLGSTTLEAIALKEQACIRVRLEPCRSGGIFWALAPGLAASTQVLLVLIKKQGLKPPGCSRLRHG